MEVETKEEDQTHPQVNVEDNLPSQKDQSEEVNTMDSKDEEIVECPERSGK